MRPTTESAITTFIAKMAEVRQAVDALSKALGADLDALSKADPTVDPKHVLELQRARHLLATAADLADAVSTLLLQAGAANGDGWRAEYLRLLSAETQAVAEQLRAREAAKRFGNCKRFPKRRSPSAGRCE